MRLSKNAYILLLILIMSTILYMSVRHLEMPKWVPQNSSVKNSPYVSAVPSSKVNSEPSPTTVSAQDVQPIERIVLKDFFNEFSKNGAYAKKTWFGRRVKVSGVIEAINILGAIDSGDYFVYISQTVKKEKDEATCTFSSKEQEELIMEAETGMEITAIGTVDSVGYSTLDLIDCKISGY